MSTPTAPQQKAEREPVQFTKRQIQDWRDYEEVREEGRYNMFSPNARLLTGLERDEYLFVMNNYSALKKAAEQRSLKRKPITAAQHAAETIQPDVNARHEHKHN